MQRLTPTIPFRLWDGVSVQKCHTHVTRARIHIEAIGDFKDEGKPVSVQKSVFIANNSYPSCQGSLMSNFRDRSVSICRLIL